VWVRALGTWFVLFLIGVVSPCWPLVRKLTPYEYEHCGYDMSVVKKEFCPECGKARKRIE